MRAECLVSAFLNPRCVLATTAFVVAGIFVLASVFPVAEARADVSVQGVTGTASAAATDPAVARPVRQASQGGGECVYSTSVWHVAKRTVVDRRTVRKPYAALTAEERDPGEPRCSVCESDQVRIDPAELGLGGLPGFRVCHVYVEPVKAALRALAKEPSVRIESITGYRPGRTRGPIVDGVRTWFSNHSYGTAIDINASHNGLYTSCDVKRLTPGAIRKCRLQLGGRWNPLSNPRETIVEGGAIHREFTRFWRWGGAIPGRTKDMMHFSITGY